MDFCQFMHYLYSLDFPLLFCPVSSAASAIWAQYGHAFQIPREAHQRPLTANLAQAGGCQVLRPTRAEDAAAHEPKNRS